MTTQSERVDAYAETARYHRPWYWYDWANSAFVTTVGTVLFGPYLTTVAKEAACPGISSDDKCSTPLYVVPAAEGLPGWVSSARLRRRRGAARRPRRRHRGLRARHATSGAPRDRGHPARCSRPSSWCSPPPWTRAPSPPTRSPWRRSSRRWSSSWSARSPTGPSARRGCSGCSPGSGRPRPSACSSWSAANWRFGAAMMVIASISLGASLVVYDAILCRIASPDDRDKVSSRGWAMGYLGGGLLLAINLVIVSAPGPDRRRDRDRRADQPALGRPVVGRCSPSSP